MCHSEFYFYINYFIVISVIDARTAGMSLLELNGLGTVMVGGADLQQWEVQHQIPVFHMVLLMDTMYIITFQLQDLIKDQLGSLCHHFGMKTV